MFRAFTFCRSLIFHAPYYACSLDYSPCFTSLLKYRSVRLKIISVAPPLTWFPLSQTRANLNRWSILRNHLDCLSPFFIFHLYRLAVARFEQCLDFVKSIYRSRIIHIALLSSSAHVRLPRVRQLPIRHATQTLWIILLILVRNHRFSYPPFHFSRRRIPTALCRPCRLPFICALAFLRLF